MPEKSELAFSLYGNTIINPINAWDASYPPMQYDNQRTQQLTLSDMAFARNAPAWGEWWGGISPDS